MECLKHCEEMIAQESASFYSAFSLLPAPRRQAVYVIYAFCRMLDDSVDEPWKGPYSLEELTARFDRLEEAEGHFVWPALRWLFETFPGLTKEPFYRQIEGQRKDMAFSPYRTMEELERYCDLVAGTVGEMLLPVLHDNPGREEVEAGNRLGKAMQLVNVIRDVGEDLRRGKRYIPLELMNRFGYREEQFADESVDDNFRRLLRYLSSLAREWFSAGLTGLDTYPPHSAFSVELAARFYEAILDAVKDNGYEVFRRRAVVGTEAKLALFLDVRNRHAAAKADVRDAVS